MKPIARRLCKRYSHVSGLAQRTAIFEGTELDLIFDERPKSVIATVNSFSENKTLLKSDGEPSPSAASSWLLPQCQVPMNQFLVLVQIKQPTSKNAE